MSRVLTDQEIAGAIRELTMAVAELAQKSGQAPPPAELSASQAMEVDRICLSNPRMLSVPDLPPAEQDFRPAQAGREVLRLTATAPRYFQPSSQILALTSAGVAPLMSKWGSPVTYAGAVVADTVENRVRFARVLPPYVTDVTDSDSEDVSSMVGRPTGGLGSDDVDQGAADARVPNARPTAAQIQAILDQMKADGSWDLGPDVSGFGRQTTEVSNPGAVADPAAEVNRLVKAGVAAGVTGLRTGATKNRHPQTGQFTSRQAKLTGTLSGV